MEHTLCDWHRPLPLAVPPLGPGTAGDARARIQAALARVTRQPEVRSLVLFGSRARREAHADSDLDLLVVERTPHLEGEALRQAWWRTYQLLGDLPLPLDLVVAGSADADRLAGSRWHVISHAAREGQVLYVAE